MGYMTWIYTDYPEPKPPPPRPDGVAVNGRLVQRVLIPGADLYFHQVL